MDQLQIKVELSFHFPLNFCAHRIKGNIEMSQLRAVGSVHKVRYRFHNGIFNNLEGQQIDASNRLILH